jgi:APA family basic amino acid/polyamine antiporter
LAKPKSKNLCISYVPYVVQNQIKMSTLKKSLSTYGLTMIVIGSCIGVGIFLTPAQTAKYLGSPFWIIIAWTVGGIIALTGALTFAELGGLFPKAGGVYVFLKNAYGDFVAFLYGFAILLVITSGALAALAQGFAEYASKIIPLSDFEIKIVGVAVLVITTLVNLVGVKVGEYLISFFTTTKLIGIGFVILIGLFIALPKPTAVDFVTTTAPDNLASVFFLALIGVYFSYGGWHHASYLAAETENPKRTIPRVMIIGTIVVTIVYVLINFAYLYMLPILSMGDSKALAADAMSLYFMNGGQMIAILIMVSIFGTISIYTMSAPRIYFAMAKDGVFFKQLAKIHPKFKTPFNAILLQSSWAIVLILFWDTFNDLITYVVFMDLLFMVLAAISIFIFRKKLADTNRPYRTLGYPVIPMIYILISTIFVINTLIEKPIQALAGLGLTLMGFIFYWYFKNNVSSEK